MANDASSVTNDSHPSERLISREEIVDLFRRRQAAYENLDAAALAADYAQDCVVDSPSGGTHRSPAAVRDVFKSIFGAFLDLKVRVARQLIDGNYVVQIVNIDGTHIAEFLGMPPSGKPFHLIAAFEYELRDGQIARERRIYDFTGMLIQIGSLKARPS